MKTFEEFERKLKEVNRLKDQIKSLCMIYQLEAKQDAAAAFNKPIHFYYHYSYEKWSKVSKALVKKRERVEKECAKLGIPGNLPYCKFPHYFEKMGLKRLGYTLN